MSSKHDHQIAVWRERTKIRLGQRAALRDHVHQTDRQPVDDHMEVDDSPLDLSDCTPHPAHDGGSEMEPFVISSLTQASLLELTDAIPSSPLNPAVTSGPSTCYCNFVAAAPPTPFGLSLFAASSSGTGVTFAFTGLLHEFTCFPRLPLEIRNMVWTEACFLDRAIPLQCHSINGREFRKMLSNGQRILPHRYTSYAKQPAILHTSQEARAVGLQHYVLEFGATDCQTVDGVVVQGSLPGRLYINFASDIICPIPRPSKGSTDSFDRKMYQNIIDSSKLRRLGLRSAEIDRRIWHTILERNTSITEVVLVSEIAPVNAILQHHERQYDGRQFDGIGKVSIHLDSRQGYIDRTWARAGLDDDEEDRLLGWKYKIKEELRMDQLAKEFIAQKNGTAPPAARVIPEISFGILKAKVEAPKRGFLAGEDRIGATPTIRE